MCSLMYSFSMKPQYENWCNCCVVSLFSPWLTPGPSFYFFALSFFFLFSSLSPLFHAPLLSVSLFAVSFLLLYLLLTFSLLLPVLFLSHSLSVLQCFTPSIPHSHRGLIYFHYYVKRGAFVCHQQRSHGAMPGVTARVTDLQSLLPSLTRMHVCAWYLLHVGGKSIVFCVSECEKVLFCIYVLYLHLISATLAVWMAVPVHPSVSHCGPEWNIWTATRWIATR